MPVGVGLTAEFVFAWADVRIAETDDVAKLLEARECRHGGLCGC